MTTDTTPTTPTTAPASAAAPASIAITVPLKTLRALALFAATQDVRWYLNALAFDLTDPADPFIVATDGARAMALRVKDAPGCTITQHGECLPLAKDGGRMGLVPSSIMAGLKKITGRAVAQALVTITLRYKGDGLTGGWDDALITVSTPAGVTTEPAALVEGRYPDWSRVVGPRVYDMNSSDPCLLDYSFDKLADLREALTLLGLIDPRHEGFGTQARIYGAGAAGAAVKQLRVSAASHGVYATVMGLRR